MGQSADWLLVRRIGGNSRKSHDGVRTVPQMVRHRPLNQRLHNRHRPPHAMCFPILLNRTRIVFDRFSGCLRP